MEEVEEEVETILGKGGIDGAARRAMLGNFILEVADTTNTLRRYRHDAGETASNSLEEKHADPKSWALR
jgi:hypothetical protein